MPKEFLIISVAGLVFLIYAWLSRNKINCYNQDIKLVAAHKEAFYRLQWVASLMISICF